MAKILPAAPFEGANENLAATTAPQDVSREDAATFDVLRKMREDILMPVERKPETEENSLYIVFERMAMQ